MLKNNIDPKLSLNEIVKILIPYSEKVTLSAFELTEKYRSLNEEINDLLIKETEIKSKESNITKINLDLELIEKKIKEKNSLKNELHSFLEHYIRTITNSQVVVDRRIQEEIKRKLELQQKEALLDSFLKKKGRHIPSSNMYSGNIQSNNSEKFQENNINDKKKESFNIKHESFYIKPKIKTRSLSMSHVDVEYKGIKKKEFVNLDTIQVNNANLTIFKEEELNRKDNKDDVINSTQTVIYNRVCNIKKLNDEKREIIEFNSRNKSIDREGKSKVENSNENVQVSPIIQNMFPTDLDFTSYGSNSNVKKIKDLRPKTIVREESIQDNIGNISHIAVNIENEKSNYLSEIIDTVEKEVDNDENNADSKELDKKSVIIHDKNESEIDIKFKRNEISKRSCIEFIKINSSLFRKPEYSYQYVKASSVENLPNVNEILVKDNLQNKTFELAMNEGGISNLNGTNLEGLTEKNEKDLNKKISKSMKKLRGMSFFKLPISTKYYSVCYETKTVFDNNSKYLFKSSNNITRVKFPLEEKTNNRYSCQEITTEKLIEKEKIKELSVVLKKLVNGNSKKSNILISTDFINLNEINLLSALPISKVQIHKEKGEKQSTIIERLKINEIPSNLNQIVMNSILLFPDNKLARHVIKTTKIFSKFKFDESNQRVLLYSQLNIHPAFFKQAYLESNEYKNQKLYEDDSISSPQLDSNIDGRTRQKGGSILKKNKSGDLNQLETSKRFKSFSLNMNCEFVKLNITKKNNIISINNRIVISLFNEEDKIAYITNIDENDENEQISREKRSMSQMPVLKKLLSKKNRESIDDNVEKKQLNEFELVSISQDNDEDYLSEEMIMKFQKQEQILKEIAEDSVKKQIQIKNLSNLINLMN